MSDPRPEFVPYGDAAILVRYKTKGYDARVMDQIHDLAEALQSQTQETKGESDARYWDNIVPGYDSLLVAFNPSLITQAQAIRRIEDRIKARGKTATSGPVIEIPVAYGGTFGPDMQALQRSSGLSIGDIIARHATPRLHVPAGSIGIAGWQTGIYGLSSPGGWQIIGRTSAAVFDAKREAPFLLKAGDRVRFIPSGPQIFDTASETRS